MKFNIAVDIDWIGEDGNLDETIKKEIAATVVNKVTAKVETGMIERAEKAIGDKVDDMCNNLVKEFLTKKITVTDKWGEAIIQDTSIEDVLKKKFDDFWNAEVDDSGRSGYGGYGRKQPRFKWAVDAQIKEHAKSFAKTLTDDTEKKIKENMRESLKQAMGNKLFGELGFEKLLKVESKS